MKVTPKQLKRSVNAEESYSYVTVYDVKDNKIINCGWLHYQGLPHLSGCIAAMLSNYGKLDQYWHKKLKVIINQNDKVCITTLKLKGYHY